MEQTTWEEMSFAEDNESNGSARPTGPAPPIDTHETSLRAFLGTYCDRLELSAIQKLNLPAVWIKYKPTVDVLDRIKPKVEHIQTDSFYSIDKAELARNGRKFEAKMFTGQFAYGGYNNSIEQRTCIWPEDTCLWSEKSTGIMWVAVHGGASVCVVTGSKDLDTERLLGNLQILSVQNVLTIFRKSIICEIEDLADPSSELRQRFDHSIKKPFGVVSANTCTNAIHKERGHEGFSAGYDGKQAIKFLRGKLKCDTDFTVSETIKTAICAFQRLFQKKLKATEIAVSVMDPEYFVPNTDIYKDATVEELDISEIQKYLGISEESGPEEIEEHSVVINDTGTPFKKQRTSLVSESPVLFSGGSSNTSKSTEFKLISI